MELPARTDPVARALTLGAAALGLYLYLGRLGGIPLQRGNEAMYSWPPIQMLESGDYLVTRYEGQTFLEKPGLTLWIVAASYRLLGISVFAARLPAALAGLATVLILGLWVGRRSGGVAGLLAALILMFSFQFVFVAMTYSADAFLALAVLAGVLAVDSAARREDGRDAAWGALCGSALALAFYFKGLLGIVLPLGAVSSALLLDRQRPIRPLRRGAQALLWLLALVAPWHWAMAHRLGTEFWRVFYWENQFLRGATGYYMVAGRGPLYYLPVLAAAVFPWSLHLPASGLRRRPSLPAGWLLFGLAFLSLLVMKREVYLVPLLPAASALAAEGFSREGRLAAAWRRIAWILASVAALGVLSLWAYRSRALAVFAGRGATLLLGLGLAVFAAAVSWAALAATDRRALLATALACGALCLALRVLDERLARFDPLPEWGERVRKDCAGECDGFLVGPAATSLDFYSRMDWTWLDLKRLDLARMRHRKGYLLIYTFLEPKLSSLPMKWEVVDRRADLGSYGAALLFKPMTEAMESLSLVRLEAGP